MPSGKLSSLERLTEDANRTSLKQSSLNPPRASPSHIPISVNGITIYVRKPGVLSLYSTPTWSLNPTYSASSMHLLKGRPFFSPLPLCISSDLPNLLPSLLHLFQLAFLLVDLPHSNPLYAFNTGLQRCLPIKEIWSCHSPAWRELPGGLIWILWHGRDFPPPASSSSSLPTSLPPLLLPGMLCSSHIKSLFPELAIFSLLPLHVVWILFSLTCHKISSLSFNANSNESRHSLIHSLIQHNYF